MKLAVSNLLFALIATSVETHTYTRVGNKPPKSRHHQAHNVRAGHETARNKHAAHNLRTGHKNKPRIVGGTPVGEGDFPFFGEFCIGAFSKSYFLSFRAHPPGEC